MPLMTPWRLFVVVTAVTVAVMLVLAWLEGPAAWAPAPASEGTPLF